MQQTELFKPLQTPSHKNSPRPASQSEAQPVPNNDKVLSRTLKIEADGDHWKRKTKSKIRLKGDWLDRAGFKPGNRVSVKNIAPGVIELRSKEIT